jgi:hypothetical protein
MPAKNTGDSKRGGDATVGKPHLGPNNGLTAPRREWGISDKSFVLFASLTTSSLNHFTEIWLRLKHCLLRSLSFTRIWPAPPPWASSCPHPRKGGQEEDTREMASLKHADVVPFLPEPWRLRASQFRMLFRRQSQVNTSPPLLTGHAPRTNPQA